MWLVHSSWAQRQSWPMPTLTDDFAWERKLHQSTLSRSQVRTVFSSLGGALGMSTGGWYNQITWYFPYNQHLDAICLSCVFGRIPSFLLVLLLDTYPLGSSHPLPWSSHCSLGAMEARLIDESHVDALPLQRLACLLMLLLKGWRYRRPFSRSVVSPRGFYDWYE